MNKEIAEKVIKNALGSDWKVESIKEIKGGFISNAFLINVVNSQGEKGRYFAKTDKGVCEREEDVIGNYLISHKTSELGLANPRSLGCFVFNERGDFENIGNLFEKSTVLHLQEFREGKSYLDELLNRDKSHVFDDEDKNVVEKIIHLIFRLHCGKINIPLEKQKMLYKRSLRDIIAHPELTLNIFENNLKNSKVFSGDFRYDYLREMIKVSEYFSNRHDRICVVHGDFWMNNIVIDEKSEPFFIDYSRFCYGDPGMDVGHFYISTLWFSLHTGRSYLKNLAEYFLDCYIEKSGDREILKTATIKIGFTGAIGLVEEFCPDASDELRKVFAEYIFKCLKKKEVIRDYRF